MAGKFTSRRWLALLSILAITISACGTRDDRSRNGSSGGGSSVEGDAPGTGGDDVFIGYLDRDADLEGEPETGGTFVVAPYVWGRSLDPGVQNDSGIGAGELGLFYDALARYDYETEEFVPWLAESIESDDTYSEWTVTLREGVHFSDGTALDAEAVKTHVDRSRESRGGYLEGVEVEVAEPLSVIFRLHDPWPGFAYALSVNPGRIVSPKALAEFGDDITSNPVGTGPFLLKSWAPGEELVAVRNPDYWAGKPKFDEVRFVNILGDEARRDALKTGDIHLSYFRDDAIVSELREDGFRGFLNIYANGETLLINNGVHSEDSPGADVRVRQAIAHAIDLDLLRSDFGADNDLWTKQMFGKVPGLDLKVEATPYDPDKASALLHEAMADGYDGKIELTCDVSPYREREAVAIQAQLNAVGFDVTIDRVASPAETIQKYQQDGDFDLACYGFSFQGPWLSADVAKLLGAGNTLGYDDPEIEDLVAGLRHAVTSEEMSSAADALQQHLNETQPVVPLAATAELIAWSDSARGIELTTFGHPVYSDAWLAQ